MRRRSREQKQIAWHKKRRDFTRSPQPVAGRLEEKEGSLEESGDKNHITRPNDK